MMMTMMMMNKFNKGAVITDMFGWAKKYIISLNNTSTIPILGFPFTKPNKMIYGKYFFSGTVNVDLFIRS